MQSRTSFFNKTIFKKNLTRFAPVWVVYTICLLLGLILSYTDGGTLKRYWFAYHMQEMMTALGVVNLGYALISAQLLFGDLYNSRMCNALHALPLRRESWFVTNVISGMVFSLVPTAVMALVAAPLLMGSIFEGAAALAWWLFLGANLQYLCYFGLAVFSAMCVGNRFTMIAGYGLLNAGAYIGYWLVDTVYTPMLYGVITPNTMVNNLTPAYHLTNFNYFEMDSRSQLAELFGEKLEGATAVFSLSEHWWRLWIMAAAGLVFLLLALVLYRKRDLECAGDAVAFRALVPVFQVLCAVFVATGAQFFLYAFLGMSARNYLVLAAGLIVGWFVGKMLIERSTRVFRLKNWYGLAALALVFAASLWLTHIDILGIETYQPGADKVKSVFFESDYTSGTSFEKPEDIEAMLRLQKDALENRAEDAGTYVLGTNGEWVRYVDTNADVIDEEKKDNRYTYVADIGLRFELTNGKIIRRRYNIWVESEAGEIAKDYLSRWESIDYRTVTIDGQKYNRLDLILPELTRISVDFLEDEELIRQISTRENAESLLEAVRADCEAHTMAQHPFFHTGHFRYENEHAEDGYSETSCIGIGLQSEKYSWYLDVYPDSVNTVRWLQQHGLLNMELRTENIRQW